MLIDVELLTYLKRADQGCPECQYIMAKAFRHGFNCAKDRERSKYYYQLLVQHSPEALSFLKANHDDFYLLLGYAHCLDGEKELASKYLNLALEYYKVNYPYEVAKQKIQEAEIYKYLDSLEW